MSQESGQVVWYSHLFKNFPEFVVHTVKGFGMYIKNLYICIYTDTKLNMFTYKHIHTLRYISISVYYMSVIYTSEFILCIALVP